MDVRIIMCIIVLAVVVTVFGAPLTVPGALRELVVRGWGLLV